MFEQISHLKWLFSVWIWRFLFVKHAFKNYFILQLSTLFLKCKWNTINYFWLHCIYIFFLFSCILSLLQQLKKNNNNAKRKKKNSFHFWPAPDSRTCTEVTHIGVAIHTLQSGNFLVNSALRQAQDKEWAAAPGVTSTGNIYMTRLQTVFTRLIRTTRRHEAWWSGHGQDTSEKWTYAATLTSGEIN